MSLEFLNNFVKDEESCFIVAEVGVNHNQNLKLAKKIVIEASNAGANAVKFQTWKTENIILKDTAMAKYQKSNLNSAKSHETSQYEMLKNLEMPYEWHYELKDLAEDYGLIFFSTMEDKQSVDFLIKDLKIPLIKIGSGDLTNYSLIKYTATFGVPLVVSTGMANMGEIDEALRTIYQEKNQKLILLQCTSQYPCSAEDVNLRAMLTLREAFKTSVGFSDHSLGLEMSIAAVALGAMYIERHFTVDRSLPGPDHKASLEPRQFKKMVSNIRRLERGMGDGFKSPLTSELKNREIVRRKMVANRDIRKDEILNEDNIAFKRANNGLDSKYYKLIAGEKAKKNIKRNDIISFSQVFD